MVSPLLLFTENLTKFETEEILQTPSIFRHVISVAESERIAYSFNVKESYYVAGDIVRWDGEKKVEVQKDDLTYCETHKDRKDEHKKYKIKG